jgi:hypothetical protein
VTLEEAFHTTAVTLEEACLAWPIQFSVNGPSVPMKLLPKARRKLLVCQGHKHQRVYSTSTDSYFQDIPRLPGLDSTSAYFLVLPRTSPTSTTCIRVHPTQSIAPHSELDFEL